MLIKQCTFCEQIESGVTCKVFPPTLLSTLHDLTVVQHCKGNNLFQLTRQVLPRRIAVLHIRRSLNSALCIRGEMNGLGWLRVGHRLWNATLLTGITLKNPWRILSNPTRACCHTVSRDAINSNQHQAARLVVHRVPHWWLYFFFLHALIVMGWQFYKQV